MIEIRKPEQIHQAHGRIEKGTFRGRWHFSFDEYFDPEYTQFGTLRVFNDDTLSPGAVWPLHPHREIEVVTYCAEGEFRHADEHGQGGILHAGDVQHTTVGRGMYHSEINHRADRPMRFIQMWFIPVRPNLEPAVQQKQVARDERTDRLLALVSNRHPGALPIAADAQVFAGFLQAGKAVDHHPQPAHGVYLYVVEGGPVHVNEHPMPALGAAKITEETDLHITARAPAELLLLEVSL